MQHLVVIGELPVEQGRREQTERCKQQRRETRHDSGGNQQAAAELQGNDGRQQQRRHAGLLHIGGRAGIIANEAETLVQEDEDQQTPACKQAGISQGVFSCTGHGHQLTFAALVASSFSRSSRSSQPCGHNFVRTASCSRAFGKSPIST